MVIDVLRSILYGTRFWNGNGGYNLLLKSPSFLLCCSGILVFWKNVTSKVAPLMCLIALAKLTRANQCTRHGRFATFFWYLAHDLC